MNVSDPRERYDDLIEVRNEEEIDAGTFDALADSEAFTAGWVVGAVVVHEEDVLLVYDGEDGAWMVPGGSVQPGETLAEAVVRELDEETGVRIVPDRPHAVAENVVTCGGERRIFRFVTFAARAKSRTVGEDLGEPDEAIEAARWFADLPENLFDREYSMRVVDRIRRR